MMRSAGCTAASSWRLRAAHDPVHQAGVLGQADHVRVLLGITPVQILPITGQRWWLQARTVSRADDRIQLVGAQRSEIR